jgi:hypothetical protein
MEDVTLEFLYMKPRTWYISRYMHCINIYQYQNECNRNLLLTDAKKPLGKINSGRAIPGFIIRDKLFEKDYDNSPKSSKDMTYRKRAPTGSGSAYM